MTRLFAYLIIAALLLAATSPILGEGCGCGSDTCQASQSEVGFFSRDFHAFSDADDVVAGADLSGMTFIVTGGSGGLGLETVRSLARTGAEVVMAARDKKKSLAALEEVLQETGASRSKVYFLPLDLASLKSVNQFTKRWGSKPLNGLVNNAGIMATPYYKTEDGFESQIGVDHFGHFLLTHRLVEALKQGARRNAKNSRIVNVSSYAHNFAPPNLEDINFEKTEYNKWQSYGAAKTANIFHANSLDKRLAKHGVRAFSLHPGGIVTELQRHLSKEDLAAVGWLDEKTGTFNEELTQFFKSPQQGASTQVWAAMHAELEGKGGLYLEDCMKSIPSEQVTVKNFTGRAKYVYDDEAAEALFKLSLDMLNLTESTYE